MAEKPSILVVDDDTAILSLVSDLLSDAGYRVKTVTSAFQARGALLKQRPSLVIMDRKLPDAEGVDFVREIRVQESFRTLPILFLTAKGAASDKVEGLRSGGDDYLGKPFSREELLARVEALLRRVTRPVEPLHVLRAKGIVVNLDKHEVEVGGKLVDLSPKEFELLAVFLEKRRRVLDRRFLLERVWGTDMGLRMNIKTVDVAIGRLRTTLGAWGEHIVAVQAYGYRLDVDD